MSNAQLAGFIEFLALIILLDVGTSMVVDEVGLGPHFSDTRFGILLLAAALALVLRRRR